MPLALAFALAFALFAGTGFDAAEIVGGLIEGAVTGNGALPNTVRWAIPLVVIGLGIAVSLRAGEFNIGAQGQFLMGSVAAVWVALRWDLPQPAVYLAAAVIAIALGAAWSCIAGVLKVLWGADEVITTLMLNFVALQVVVWITTSPLKDPLTSGDAASTSRIDSSLRFQGSGEYSPELIVLALLLIAGVWLLLERSGLGLALRLTGANPTAAQCQGLSVRRVRLWSYLIAGGLAGLAGALEVFGPAGRVVTGSTPTLGFTALVVATVGSLTVSGTVSAALFFGGLQAAILYLPIVSDLPPSGLRIIEGVVALLITAQLAAVLRRRRNSNRIPASSGEDAAESPAAKGLL
ncbi:MAG: ABC transporter permease [bacterium]|nr:ABC transporter permease [bacterium]MCY4271630.1 ABC transporter permease [bacterium]